MLKQFLAVLTALMIVTGCGINDGSDGQSGKDGKPGETGGTGENGKPGENGAPGKPGEGAVIGYSVCAISWPGTADTGAYDILYSVMYLKEGAAHIDFQAKYKTAGNISFSESASVVAISGASALETQGWKAELKSKTEATVTRKALNETKTVACTYKG